MSNQKLMVALLTIAIIGLAAFVLGCTSSTQSPTPVPSGNPAATDSPVSGTITVAGSSSVGPHIEGYIKPAFEALHNGVKVNVLISDSGTGIKTTEAGDCDIGMSSRALKPEDGADLIGTVIAYDGIAVIISNANIVENLSKQQIIDIFSGKITSWKDVGGKDSAIDVYQREASSGTRSAFNDLVMKPTNVSDRALQATNTLNMIQSIKGNPRAIGYCSFGELSSDVKALKIDGVAPTQATIKDKTYPVQRPFLLVTKGQPINPAVIEFIGFVTGKDGQDILTKNNLISIL
jgi:phosphate transport system substrate-binding protein